MHVETYIMPETEELVTSPEALSEWQEQVDKLGLVGQKAITKKQQTPIVFMPVNRRLLEAIKVLCPSSCELKEYRHDAIPLPALEAAKMAIEKGFFQKIEVRWDDATPDPIMLGMNGLWYTSANYSKHFSTKAECEAQANGAIVHFLEREHFLIARWGAEAKALSQLILDAKERFISEAKRRLTQAIRTAQRELDDVELTAQERFG
jgi:hypothetical protein